MGNIDIKHPDDVLDYKSRWATWLASTDGDSIATVEWTVPAGLVELEDRRSNDETSATIWLTGGVDRVDYDVYCQITTVQGRVAVDYLTIPVRVR